MREKEKEIGGREKRGSRENFLFRICDFILRIGNLILWVSNFGILEKRKDFWENFLLWRAPTSLPDLKSDFDVSFVVLTIKLIRDGIQSGIFPGMVRPVVLQSFVGGLEGLFSVITDRQRRETN